LTRALIIVVVGTALAVLVGGIVWVGSLVTSADGSNRFAGSKPTPVAEEGPIASTTGSTKPDDRNGPGDDKAPSPATKAEPIADEKKSEAPTKASAEEQAKGLSPGRPIDEREIPIPTKRRFNPKSVNETAEWVIARTKEVNQHGENGFLLKTEQEKLDAQLKDCIGQKVEWEFTVHRILGEAIALNQTWSTFDGSRYPGFDGLSPPRGLTTVPRFQVRFYHEGKELFDPVRGPLGGPGAMDYKREPNGMARLAWADGGLVIGDEFDKASALRLRPKDVIKVKARVKVFGMGPDLYGPDLPIPFGPIVPTCTLEPDLTEEAKRERHELDERQRQADEQRRQKAIGEAQANREKTEAAAREREEEEKRLRAQEIAHYWGAVEEWKAEVVRTGGKEPDGQWQRKWQEKWAPIPPLEKLYRPEAIAELREEERGGKVASKEWIKKWREKWDQQPPDP
jgi:hypothetical protein